MFFKRVMVTTFFLFLTTLSSPINARVLILKDKSGNCTYRRDSHFQQSCLDSMYTRTDMEMERVYQRLIKHLWPQEKISVYNMQQDWLLSMKESCKEKDDLPKKACQIDRIIARTAFWELIEKIYQDLGEPNIRKPYEGSWVNCFYNKKGRQEYCIGYHIVQENNRLCGQADKFVGYQVADLNFRALVNAKNTTATTDFCITYKHPYANTNCFYNKSYIPKDLEVRLNNEYTFKICDKSRLFVLDEESAEKSCSDLKQSETDTPYVYLHRLNQKAPIRELIKTDWLDACLAGEKVLAPQSIFKVRTIIAD